MVRPQSDRCITAHQMPLLCHMHGYTRMLPLRTKEVHVLQVPAQGKAAEHDVN